VNAVLQIQINPPQISEETMKEMAIFFMKTSIPRILEQMKKEGKQGGW
jgi:hypothetical protein